jgi:hypothetical protein
MKNGSFSVAWIASSMMLFIAVDHLAAAPITKNTLPSIPASLPSGYVDNMDWTQETWREDDTHLSRVQNEVKSRLSGSADTLQVMRQYRSLASKDLYNADAVFRWGCASYIASSKAKTLDEERDIWVSLYPALLHPALPNDYKLAATPSAIPKPITPHSYRYTRLLFLVAVHNRVADVKDERQLLALCDRLLERNPNDRTVKFARIEMLMHLKPVSSREDPIVAKQSKSLLEAARLKALGFSKQAVTENPSNLPLLVQLAGIYNFLWDGKNGYDQMAIATYRRYLALAPSTDPYVKTVNDTITKIEGSKSLFQNK